VSLLCNNAGVALAVRAEQMSYETWDFALGVNLGGVVNGLQTFLPRMIARAKELGGRTRREHGLGRGRRGPRRGLSVSRGQVRGRRTLGVTALRARRSDRCVGALSRAVATRIVHHTLRTQPPSAPKPAEQMIAVIDGFLNAGVAPDSVGEMVLRGVLDNALYIHTDRIIEAPLQARTRALLESLPGAPR
jgi:hypothetical protein